MKKTKSFWLGLLLIGIIISVPEGTLIRIASSPLDASVITMLRYIVAALLALPFVVTALLKKQLTLKHLGVMSLVAVPLSLDPLITQYVIATTSASFFAILGLSGPIVFVIISTLITRDSLRRNQVIGFLFAVLGGIVMIALPAYGATQSINFGAVPVLLMLIHAICVSLGIIYWRKENERGMPMIVLLGVFYFIWAVIAAMLVLFSGKTEQLQHLTLNNLVIIVYLGLVASIIYNAIFTRFYRHVGTTNAATMRYFKESLTVIMPIIILGEALSWPMALGAFLIVLGTLVVHKK